MALFGDVAKQALSKAEEVYRLIVTVQVQIEHLVQKVKDSDHNLTERHRDLVQRQHNFEMAVNAKLADFEARLRAVEKDQEKLHGKVGENYAKVIVALAEQHLGKQPTRRGFVRGFTVLGRSSLRQSCGKIRATGSVLRRSPGILKGPAGLLTTGSLVRVQQLEPIVRGRVRGPQSGVRASARRHCE